MNMKLKNNIVFKMICKYKKLLTILILTILAIFILYFILGKLREGMEGGSTNTTSPTKTTELKTANFVPVGGTPPPFVPKLGKPCFIVSGKVKDGIDSDGNPVKVVCAIKEDNTYEWERAPTTTETPTKDPTKKESFKQNPKPSKEPFEIFGNTLPDFLPNINGVSKPKSKESFGFGIFSLN